MVFTTSSYWTCFFGILTITTRRTASFEYHRALVQLQHPGFGSEWVVVDVEDGEEIIGYYKSPAKSQAEFAAITNPEDAITFTLFTRDNKDGVVINSDEDLTKYYNKTKPTKFVTHGWLSGGDKNTCTQIRDGFLHKYDANVIVMDWGQIAANPFYPIAVRATTTVGEFYGKFLEKLIDFGADPKQFHLVGHSLGAHVSGFAARTINQTQIGRITGLDPAGPGFGIQFVQGGRLHHLDAEFVDVIHTCAGYLGIKEAIGDADFYPNNGDPPQPGCGDILKIVEACSHGRSWKYFVESLIESSAFMAYPCKTVEDECVTSAVPMGDSAPNTARGSYYLTTNDKNPFAIETNRYQGPNCGFPLK